MDGISGYAAGPSTSLTGMNEADRIRHELKAREIGERYTAERGPGENPPVAELLTIITGALEGAHKALENLVQKVRPVTGEARPTDETIKAAPPTHYTSPVAEELARILDSIGGLEDKALRVAARIEV